MDHFIGGKPIKVTNWCPIVNMDSMIHGKFPPGWR